MSDGDPSPPLGSALRPRSPPWIRSERPGARTVPNSEDIDVEVKGGGDCAREEGRDASAAGGGGGEFGGRDSTTGIGPRFRRVTGGMV